LMFHGPSTTTSAAHPGYSGHMFWDSRSPVRNIRTEDRTIQATDDERSTPHQDQPQVEKEVEPIQHQAPIPHPRVHQIIQKNHPVDNILGSISKGVTTHSRLTTFCEHYSFVFSLGYARRTEQLHKEWSLVLSWNTQAQRHWKQVGLSK
jgi:hypothetical protein